VVYYDKFNYKSNGKWFIIINLISRVTVNFDSNGKWFITQPVPNVPNVHVISKKF